MRLKLTIAFMVLAALAGSWQLTTEVSAQRKLTLAMILTGLQTQGKTPETSTLAKRNIYITEQVKANGVTFRLTPDIESELRNGGATTVLIETIRRYGPVSQPTPAPTTSNSGGTPYATFKQMWVDYGVVEDGVKGMTIHTKFTTYRMRQMPSYLAIYFTDKYGTYLKDKNNKFVSGTKEVAVYKELTPCCDTTDYNDLTVFMPYSELDLPDGNYDLKMDAKIIYKAGGVISELTKYAFTYEQKDPTPSYDAESVTTTVRKVWVDYNITESGRKGMRVHVNFQVGGLKGVDSRIVIRVAKADDDSYVDGRTTAFSNESGELSATFEMKPGYDPAEYKDATIFIPYDEFSISRGKWNLKLDIDLQDGEGELIKHLQWYEFEFQKP